MLRLAAIHTAVFPSVFFMAIGQQFLQHVGAHAPEADQSNLHDFSEFSFKFSRPRPDAVDELVSLHALLVAYCECLHAGTH